MTERISNLNPVQVFLRYAVPCAFVLQQRGDIDDEELARLESAAVGAVELPRSEIEQVFFRAFERIDRVAADMGSDRWDPDVIREYFVNRHNKLIDAGDGDYAIAPQTLKDLCRVETATVTSLQGSFYVVTLPDGTSRTVIPPFVPDAKVGDKVIVHYGYAIEYAS